MQLKEQIAQNIYRRMVLLELDLEIKTPSNKTNIVEELKELNNTLSENTIQVYKGCDYREFTFENGDKIFERKKN